MIKIRNLVACGATVALVAVGHNVFSQDDLDDLLNDLESSAPATSEAVADAVEAPAEAPAVEAEPEVEPEAEVAAEAPAEAPAVEAEPEVAVEAPAEAPAVEAEPEVEPEAEVAVEAPAEAPAVEAEPEVEPEVEPEAEVAAEAPAEAPAVEAEPEAEVAVEAPAEAPAAEAEPEAEVAAEAPAEEQSIEDLLAEPEAEVAAEAPAEAPAVEAEPEVEPEAEVAAEAPAEEQSVEDLLAEPETEVAAEAPAEEQSVENLLAEPEAEVAAEAPAEAPVAEAEPEAEVAAEAPAEAPAVVAEPPAPKIAKIPETDREVIENAIVTENIRRKAFNLQAMREIEEAHACMANQQYQDVVKHYTLASKLLNDSPGLKDYRIECEQGIAEGWYRAALQENATGRREKAKKYMDKAVELRHPKARRQLEAWLASDDPDANKRDISEIKHVRNDEEYIDMRTRNAQHLKRSRQLLSTRQLDRALDECELVLDEDPYNQEAIRLRQKIERKRHTIMTQERQATREGLIADVDRAWRPPYAVNARKLDEIGGTTVKDPLGDNDPVRAQEQKIYARMKEMRLPSISFKPPATIIDAVDFFRGASKDYDRPDIPLEQRGFNFVLKTPEAIKTQAAASAEEDTGFGSSDAEDSAPGAPAGIPVIPMITASDISFYEALKLVCESVDYKFKVQGSIVMVMHKDMSTEEMVTRSYPVLSTFMDRMTGASSDLKEMKQGGFGQSASHASDEGEENQERDWKEFFELLGVKWPEGSSIMYIKTIGKLRVKNTYENLAELEKALTEMNADPKLIEIEARFVEVCQDDLNSLGFEWILNSDFSLGIGNHIGRALGLRRGVWGASAGTTTIDSSSSSSSGTSGTVTGGVINNGGITTTTTSSGTTINSTSSKSIYANSNGARWIRDGRGNGKFGINGFGGDSAYTTGNRYLSTLSNHISGEGYSTNDQFMRINAFLGGADLSMILHMLSQRSDTDLLSAPKVLTRPGEEAVMKVVTEYIYPTDYDVQLQSSSSSSGGGYGGGGQSAILAVVEPQSFTMREVGVILDVTPTLTDDGNLIDLKLNTQVVDEPTWKNYGMRIPFTGNSSLQSFQGIGEIMTGLGTVLTAIGTGLSDALKATFAETAVNSASTALDNLTANGQDNMTYYDAPMEQPFFHVRSIDSSVSVYPGATIVMGGLITEQRKAMDDKIPFLGDLPIVGRFFRSHSEQTSKRNLLIFVTTRLVDVRGREVTMSSLETKESDVTPAVEDVE